MTWQSGLRPRSVTPRCRSISCRCRLTTAALSEAAGQRLFAADVVQLLDLAAQRPERDLVLSACRSLGSIHEPCAIEALEAALARAEPAASDEIHGLLLRAARRRPPQDHPPAIPTLPRGVTP